MIYLLLIFQQLIASTTHIFAKNLTFELPPTVILLFRTIFATLFFLVFLWSKKIEFWKIPKHHLKNFIILGLLNIPLNQFLFFVSIKYTLASNVALAYSLSPVFILIIAKIYLKEKITFWKYLGILISFAGIFIILFEKGIRIRYEEMLGNILALVASISWAVFSTYGKKMIDVYGSTYTTAMSVFWGFLFYLPISLVNNDFAYLFEINSIQWLQIIYLGVMTSGIAYLIWYYAIKRLSASSVGVFNNLQPIFTTIMAVMFLGQQVSVVYILGGLLVIFGVAITQKA